MWENIITWAIVGVSALFIGRRLYRQWRAAVTPGKTVSCCSGCSCCSTQGCDEPGGNGSGMRQCR